MSSHSIKVSVIMPLYNAAKFLKRAVDMMHAQTLKEWELILVDDASTDNTEEVAKALMVNEPRIIFEKNSENKGPSYTRNRATELAKGEWIAIVDADDYITANRLEKMMNEANARSLDMIADNQKWVKAETGQFIRNLFPTDYAKYDSTITVKDYLNSISKISPKITFGIIQPLIRLEFIRKNNIKYNEEIRYGEDAVMYFDCLLNGARLGLMPDCMYTYYRRKKQSVTHSLHTANNQLIINKYLWSAVVQKKQFNLLVTVFKRGVVMSLRLIRQLISSVIKNK